MTATRQLDAQDSRPLAPPDERPLAELLKRLSEQSSRLARQEVELAKAEMSLKAKRLGSGAGALGAAGLLALLAVGALTAAAILALAIVLDAWLAATLIGVAYLVVAGVLALIGRKRIAAGSPPAPEQAIASTKRDIEKARESVKEGVAR
jgi:hypothetical protein